MTIERPTSTMPGTTVAPRGPLFRRVRGILVVVAALWFVIQVVHWAGPAGGEDLAKHWLAPQVAGEGVDPYAPGTLRARAENLGIIPPGGGTFHFLERYHYPPLNLLVWTPLSWLPLRTAVVGWIIAGAFLWLATLVLLQALVGIHPFSDTAFLFWASMLAFDPVLSTLALGQFEILVCFLLLLTLALDRADRPWLAGAPLALAVLTKLLPVVWIFGLLALGRRRTALSAVLWTTGLTVASLPILGTAPYASFLRAEGSFATLAAGWESYLPVNLSIPSFILKAASILTGGHAHEQAATWIGRALILLLVGSALAVVWRARGRGRDAELAALGCLSAATSLASPMTFQHHLVWLALPLGLALRRAVAGRVGPADQASPVAGGGGLAALRSDLIVTFLAPWILVGFLDAWGQPVRTLTSNLAEPLRGAAWSVLPALVTAGTIWIGMVAAAIALGRHSHPVAERASPCRAPSRR